MLPIIANLGIAILLIGLIIILLFRLIRLAFQKENTPEKEAFNKKIDQILFVSIIPTLVSILLYAAKTDWQIKYVDAAFETMIQAGSTDTSDAVKAKLSMLSIFDGPFQNELKNYSEYAIGKLYNESFVKYTNSNLSYRLKYNYVTNSDRSMAACLLLRLQGNITANYFLRKLSSFGCRNVKDIDNSISRDNVFINSVNRSLHYYSQAESLFNAYVQKDTKFCEFIHIIKCNIALGKIMQARLSSNISEKKKKLSEAMDNFNKINFTSGSFHYKSSYFVNTLCTIGLMYAYSQLNDTEAFGNISSLISVLNAKKKYLTSKDINQIIQDLQNPNIELYELNDLIIRNPDQWEDKKHLIINFLNS